MPKKHTFKIIWERKLYLLSMNDLVTDDKMHRCISVFGNDPKFVCGIYGPAVKYECEEIESHIIQKVEL